MAELDTLLITNPTKDDFSDRFNGELYTISAGEQKSFPEFLAFHVAKHLSDKMLGKEVLKLKAKSKDNPYNPLVGQLMVYDNPQRRVSLYEILGTKEKVEACVNSYPFKGFIGEISEYDEYVVKATAPKAPEKQKKASSKKSDEPVAEALAD